MRISRPVKKRRSAVTLLELMLTLGLLVCIAAILWPTLQRPFDQLRLQKGAEQVQGGLALTRLRALNSGQTQMFTYFAGQNQFSIQSWNSVDATNASNGGSTTTVSSFDMSQNMQDTSCPPPVLRTLPDGVILLDATIGQDAARRSNQEISAAERANSGGQSRILFYPDGSCTSAKVVLGNRQDRYVSIELRAMTGLTVASDVLSASELK